MGKNGTQLKNGSSDKRPHRLSNHRDAEKSEHDRRNRGDEFDVRLDETLLRDAWRFRSRKSAEATPSGTAKASATNETMIEPTSSGRMPYQSCQKLAVIQSRPKRNELIERYHGTGSSGDHVRNFSAAGGSVAR